MTWQIIGQAGVALWLGYWAFRAVYHWIDRDWQLAGDLLLATAAMLILLTVGGFWG